MVASAIREKINVVFDVSYHRNPSWYDNFELDQFFL